MRLYRSTFKLRSASASVWQADTLFGHLCWSLVRHQGEEFLREFLGAYLSGHPSVLLSDGFPAGYLPRPRSGVRGEPGEGLPKHERVQRYRSIKDQIKARWLTLEEFNRACGGELVMPRRQPVPSERVVSKNQIDRLTNTAGGAGGQLYDFREFCLPAVEVYWCMADGYESLVHDFLVDLQVTGYGKRKSVGYGQIKSFGFAAFDGFADISEANGFVALSNFVPASSDPTDGFWTTIVKYGKLGEEGTASGQPFKRPLIQLAAGSCFYDAPIRDWYGRLVPNVAADPQVVQYGYALPLPIQLPKRS